MWSIHIVSVDFFSNWSLVKSFDCLRLQRTWSIIFSIDLKCIIDIQVFLCDLIFMSPQHSVACLQSMIRIQRVVLTIVASLYHPKFHICQKKAIFFLIYCLQGVNPTTNVIHIWEGCIMTRLLSLWSHTPTECSPVWGGPHNAADPCKSQGLINHTLKLVFLSPRFSSRCWINYKPTR